MSAREVRGVAAHDTCWLFRCAFRPVPSSSSGLYLSNFIKGGGSKFWLLKSTTVLMHRYIEIWKPTKSSLKVIMLLVII